MLLIDPEDPEPLLELLDNNYPPPELSGIVLLDKILNLNKTDPSLEAHRAEAKQQKDGP